MSWLYVLVDLLLRPFRYLIKIWQDARSWKSARDRQALMHQLSNELRVFQSSMMQSIEQSLYLSHMQQLGHTYVHATGTQKRSSLLEARQEHYSEEKMYLCNQVVSMIADRIENGDRIILLIDAGSTVLPIVQLLCDHPVFVSLEKCARLVLVTNNLGAVDSLLHHGTVGSDATATTRFKCYFPQGEINCTYGACLGSTTAASVRNLVSDAQHNTKCTVISIVTGNYISVHDGLLARGKEHTEVKQAMIDIADECYFLAPLGKILKYKCGDLNSILKGQRKDYEVVPHKNDKKPVLVYTFRPYHYADTNTQLKLYFHDLKTSIEHAAGFDVREEWGFEIDPFEMSVRMRVERQLMDEQTAILNYEFPHPALRKEVKKSVR